MNLKQYWDVYFELGQLNDTFFLAKMRDREYVELLDTFIQRKSIVNGDKVSITPAVPGLIMPGRGDPNTRIPTNILSPNNYDNQLLWRY